MPRCFPSICLEQHGASVHEGGRREEEATERRLPFISDSSLSLSLLIIWEATFEFKKDALPLSLSPSPLVSV